MVRYNDSWSFERKWILYRVLSPQHRALRCSTHKWNREVNRLYLFIQQFDDCSTTNGTKGVFIHNSTYYELYILHPHSRAFAFWFSGNSEMCFNIIIQGQHFSPRYTGSSVVECRTRNRDSPGSTPPFATVSKFGNFRSLHDASVHSVV